MKDMEERSNTLMVLPIPDAAQGVLRPPCLLSGLAAHQHVGHTVSARVSPWSSTSTIHASSNPME